MRLSFEKWIMDQIPNKTIDEPFINSLRLAYEAGYKEGQKNIKATAKETLRLVNILVSTAI